VPHFEAVGLGDGLKAMFNVLCDVQEIRKL